MRKNCLITGSTGLIGRHVVTFLGERWKLFTVVRKAGKGVLGSVETIPILHDLSLPCDGKGFPESVDVVIHLAQSEYFREFPAHSANIFHVNTASTLYLLEYARMAKAGTFVLASSGGVYGWGDDGFNEDARIAADGEQGFYVGTKLCAEVLAENYTAFMNVIILRFFFVYGPGQRGDMLIPRLVQAVREGRAILLHGEEGFKFNPTYVTDAALAVCRALELKASHKINVGGPDTITLRRIGLEIGGILNKEPVFEVKPEEPSRHLIGDIRKMSELLSPPLVGFKQGIAKYIAGERNDPRNG